MKPQSRSIKIVIDRKAAMIGLAVVLVGGAGVVASQQLTMTATYPIPAGVYNQIVTTGDSGTTAADTTLNRNAGNTILVPQASNLGSVGIGGAPLNGIKLDVNTSGNKPVELRNAVSGGLMLGLFGRTIQAIDGVGGANGDLLLQSWSGNVGIGIPLGTSPPSMLSVNGSIQPGDDASACTAAKDGSIRWHSGVLEVCGTAGWKPVDTAQKRVIVSAYVDWRRGSGVARVDCPVPTPSLVVGWARCGYVRSAGWLAESYAVSDVVPPYAVGWGAECVNASDAIWGTSLGGWTEVFAVCE